METVGVVTDMKRSSFSLIEMIGVMAILSIIACMVVPVVVSQYDRAAWVREDKDLSTITNALVLSILQTKVIPSEANWLNAVAAQIADAPGSIATTPRNVARYFKLDPNFPVATDTPLMGGTIITNSARAMLISTIGTPLVTTDLSGANFNAIWNTPDNQRPAGWSWTGKGEDLKIQRINFEPLFHRLKLANQSTAFKGFYRIDTGLTNQVTDLGLDAYYLDGTFVSLRDATGLQEQASQLITSDVSFVFDVGFWRAQVVSGLMTNSMSSSYGSSVTNFLTVVPYKKATQGCTQQTAMMVINSFMQTYEAWANGSPCFSGSGAGPIGQALTQQMTNSLSFVTEGLVQ